VQVVGVTVGFVAASVGILCLLVLDAAPPLDVPTE
jgi:hypothetical protein